MNLKLFTVKWFDFFALRIASKQTIIYSFKTVWTVPRSCKPTSGFVFASLFDLSQLTFSTLFKSSCGLSSKMYTNFQSICTVLLTECYIYAHLRLFLMSLLGCLVTAKPLSIFIYFSPNYMHIFDGFPLMNTPSRLEKFIHYRYFSTRSNSSNRLSAPGLQTVEPR